MRHFGTLHDDAIYFIAGKSIADGRGPLMTSLPGEPSQTKYPPVIPLLAAAVWKLNPSFPANLPLAMLLSWSFLPMTVVACWLLFRCWGMSEVASALLSAFIACSGYVSFFSTAVMSELLFTALAVATFVAVDAAESKGSRAMWGLAAVLGILTYLTRSAGIVLLVAVPVGVWLRSRSFRGLWVTAGMLPAVAVWMLWVKAYRRPGMDLVTAYYTDYTKILLVNATPSNYHLFVWKNAFAWLEGLGDLLMPVLDPDPVGRFFSHSLALAALAGAVRFCIAVPRARPFGVFAAVLSAILIGWCYPPNSRLVLPVFPMVLAGFCFEAGKLIRMVREARGKQPVAAYVIGGLLVVGAVAGARQHWSFWFSAIPDIFAQQERLYAENEAAYEFVRAHTPPDANFLAWNDPAFYLHTGRHAMKIIYPLAYWYEGRKSDILGVFANADQYARENGLTYVFQNFEFTLEFSPEQLELARQKMEANAGLELVFRRGNSRIWRVVAPK